MLIIYLICQTDRLYEMENRTWRFSDTEHHIQTVGDINAQLASVFLVTRQHNTITLLSNNDNFV